MPKKLPYGATSELHGAARADASRKARENSKVAGLRAEAEMAKLRAEMEKEELL